jgi:hypothetical protein
MNRGLMGSLSTSVAIALLTGCGDSQPPIGAPGAISQSRAIAQLAARGKSWTLPEAKSEDLVSAFTTSGKLVGNLQVQER